MSQLHAVRNLKLIKKNQRREKSIKGASKRWD